MTIETLNQFKKSLHNLSALLDKAQTFADARKWDSAHLLGFRLAPDQFALVRQVQMTCDTAKGFGYKLTGKEPPAFEDKETTVTELKQRIENTLTCLEALRPEDFKGWEDRKILNPRRPGKFQPATEFMIQHAIPNFYFHLTTAYSILRSCGVEVGKKDFLGEIKLYDL
jgi:uncharacterized protein